MSYIFLLLRYFWPELLYLKSLAACTCPLTFLGSSGSSENANHISSCTDSLLSHSKWHHFICSTLPAVLQLIPCNTFIATSTFDRARLHIPGTTDPFSQIHQKHTLFLETHSRATLYVNYLYNPQLFPFLCLFSSTFFHSLFFHNLSHLLIMSSSFWSVLCPRTDIYPMTICKQV